MTAEIKAELEIAGAGIEAELLTAAAHDDFEDALLLELGKYMALTAGGWTADARAEWLNVATDELMEYPLSMLLPALKKARRSTPWPNKLVAAIAEQLEPRYDRLKAECEKIGKLRELAG